MPSTYGCCIFGKDAHPHLLFRDRVSPEIIALPALTAQIALYWHMPGLHLPMRNGFQDTRASLRARDDSVRRTKLWTFRHRQLSSCNLCTQYMYEGLAWVVAEWYFMSGWYIATSKEARKDSRRFVGWQEILRYLQLRFDGIGTHSFWLPARLSGWLSTRTR